jgi:hypothetical protein
VHDRYATVRHMVHLRTLRQVTPVVVVTVLAVDVQAQKVVNLAQRTVCSRCDMTLTPGPTLGDEEGPGALVAEPSALATDSKGRFYLTQFTTRSHHSYSITEAASSLPSAGEALGPESSSLRVPSPWHRTRAST